MGFVKQNPVMGRYFGENRPERPIWGVHASNTRDGVFGSGRLRLFFRTALSGQLILTVLLVGHGLEAGATMVRMAVARGDFALLNMQPGVADPTGCSARLAGRCSGRGF